VFHGLLVVRPQKSPVKLTESNILKMNSGPLGAPVFGPCDCGRNFYQDRGVEGTALRSGLCCEGEIRFGLPFSTGLTHLVGSCPAQPTLGKARSSKVFKLFSPPNGARGNRRVRSLWWWQAKPSRNPLMSSGLPQNLPSTWAGFPAKHRTCPNDATGPRHPLE
jgi:hypothetical protein